MSLFLFVPTSEVGEFATGGIPPQICNDTNSATITVEGVEYTRITDIETLNSCFNSLSNGVSKKQLRDCIKVQADLLGWESLTTAQRLVCAAINIGTGAQILATYPDFLDRVENSFNYICIMRGMPEGEAKRKAFYISAIVFAACKHINFYGGLVPMPQMILTYLNTNEANWGVTIEGTNYLQSYINDQVQGFTKGDGTTGLYDFFTAFAGSKYAGEGFPYYFRDEIGNPLRVTAAQWVEGGFDDVAAFTAYCIRFLDFGILGTV